MELSGKTAFALKKAKDKEGMREYERRMDEFDLRMGQIFS